MKTPLTHNHLKRLLIGGSKISTSMLMLLAAVGFYLGSGVELKLSLSDLLPENHPAVLKFNELTKIVGGVGFFTIILEANDGHSHLDIAPAIVSELRKDPLVRSVFFEREQRYFVDRLLYYMDLEKLKSLESNIEKGIFQAKSKVFDLGLWDDAPKEEKKDVFDNEAKELAQKAASMSPYLISKDKKHLLIMVKPSFDSVELDKCKDLFRQVEELVKRMLPIGVKVQYAGRYFNKIDETETIQQDILILGAVSISVILLILYIYIRSFRALIFIFAPVLFGLGITLGITKLTIGHINIVTGFLLGILSGLGVDYVIHLLLRLHLEHDEPSGTDPNPVWRVLVSSGHSVFVGACAASFSFLLLCFSSFRAFSEFGLICGVGIAAVFISLILSFGALVDWLGMDSLMKKPKRLIPQGWAWPTLSNRYAFRFGMAVSIILLVVGFGVQFEYEFDRMMQHSKKVQDATDLVDTVYERNVTPSAMATTSVDEAILLEETLKKKYIPSVVKEVVSGASIVPASQTEKQAIMLRIKDKLNPLKDKWIEEALSVPAESVRRWMDAVPFSFTDLPAHVQDYLRGTQQSGYLLYLYPSIHLNNLHGVRTYANMVRDLEGQFPKAVSGSDAVLFSDILDLIQNGGSLILFVIFLSVGVFIWANVRNLNDTLWSYLPLLVALPVGMGLMALFKIKFNIFNISIIPTFVAMGIDVPIHLVHRAKEIRSGFKAVRDLAASINLALITAGAGFGVLIFARTGVLKSLGWIALLGTIAIWWTGLFLLPALLELFYRRNGSIGTKSGDVQLPKTSAPSVK